MKIVLTLMVRDECDIINAMVQHHLDQGVDHIIATDNGSVDGTREILASYEESGVLTLHDDLRHNKQQAEVVTRMAREAATRFQADWVINADADEFWVAQDTTLTLRQALERIPTSYRTFHVPVIDMIGAPALRGSGLSRLVYRDTRPVEQLNTFGIYAHSTHDAIHIGDPQIEVVQGNHDVNISSAGIPETGHGIEVLHLQWRSWQQFENKVRNAGEAYERSGLTPSPNHHGMKDFRRLREGTLFTHYVGRHPLPSECEENEYLVRDERLAQSLNHAIPDEAVEQREWEIHSELTRSLVALEDSLRTQTGEADDYRQQLSDALVSLDQWYTRANDLEERLREREETLEERIAHHQRTTNELDDMRKSWGVRTQQRISKIFKGSSANLS